MKGKQNLLSKINLKINIRLWWWVHKNALVKISSDWSEFIAIQWYNFNIQFWNRLKKHLINCHTFFYFQILKNTLSSLYLIWQYEKVMTWYIPNFPRRFFFPESKTFPEAKTFPESENVQSLKKKFQVENFSVGKNSENSVGRVFRIEKFQSLEKFHS